MSEVLRVIDGYIPLADIIVNLGLNRGMGPHIIKHLSIKTKELKLAGHRNRMVPKADIKRIYKLRQKPMPELHEVDIAAAALGRPEASRTRPSRSRRSIG